MLTVTNLLKLAELANDIAHAVAGPFSGPLDGALVMLLTSSVAPTPTLVVGDLTEATFTGYTRSAAVVWMPPSLDDDGVPCVVGGLKQFTCSGATILNTITGWALVDSTAAILYGSELFDTPIVLGVGESVNVVPNYPVGTVHL